MRPKHTLLEKFIGILACVVIVASMSSCCIEKILHDVTLSKDSTYEAYRSVVRVSTNHLTEEDKIIMATAWAVSANKLVTAGHFCEHVVLSPNYNPDDLDLLITNKHGISIKEVKGIVGQISPFVDVCEIISNDHGLIPLKLFPFPSLVKTGDPVSVVGFPRGAPWPIQVNGTVVAIDSSDHDLIYEAITHPGSSGSPVFRGRDVVGLSYAGSTDLYNLSFAVFVTKLKEFIDELGD